MKSLYWIFFLYRNKENIFFIFLLLHLYFFSNQNQQYSLTVVDGAGTESGAGDGARWSGDNGVLTDSGGRGGVSDWSSIGGGSGVGDGRSGGGVSGDSWRGVSGHSWGGRHYQSCVAGGDGHEENGYGLQVDKKIAKLVLRNEFENIIENFK